MKSLLVVVACLLVSARCALYFTVHDEVPGHENQCYDEIDDSFCNPRDRMRSDNETCTRVTCLGRQEDGKIVIEHATCGLLMVLPGCKIVEDLSKPYPECCPQIACPEDSCNETGASE